MYPTETNPGDSWLPINLLHIASNPPAPPSIGDALYAGHRHVVSGEPESGKSWLALGWSRDVLESGSVVVYIDHEMGAPMMLERLGILGVPPNVIPRFRYVDPSESIIFAAEQIPGLIEDAELVIIDSTVGSLGLHGYDDNKSSDIEAWYQRVVAPLRASGAAIVVLDHVTKDRDTRGKYAIGSQRKVGAADVHLSVEATAPFGRHRIGTAKVTVHKDRPGHLQRPILGTFTLDPGGLPNPFSWTRYDPAADHDAEGNFRPTTLMNRVSVYLAANPPASKRMISEHVTGSTKGIFLAIDALLREGYASEQEAIGRRGGGTEIHHVSTFEYDPEEALPNRFQKQYTEPLPLPCKGEEREAVTGRNPETSASASLLSPNGSQPSLTELPRPCPICKATHSSQPYLANGGAYCCEPCAQGDACACKYLEAPA
jgi:hypothetical protein